VNNNQPLGSFMQEHIWGPLGMASTTFRLRERPDIKSRMADMSIRADDGTVQPGPSQHHRENCPEDRGGGGACTSMSDYVKVLIALLKNDGTLLKPATIDLLFTPCLSSDAAKKLGDDWSKGRQKVDTDDIELKIAKQVNHALGGMVSETDLPGGRKAGSMWWGGLPNLIWVIDRQTGLALLYGSQLLPTHEEVSRRTFRMFEAALYGGELVPIQGEVKA
jgi:CubicO group peptidase (beta-lactamase class C family)